VPLTVASTMVQRVPVYKIIGVKVHSDLKWDDHVTAITLKLGKRLVYETVEKSMSFSGRTSRLCDLSLNMPARDGT